MSQRLITCPIPVTGSMFFSRLRRSLTKTRKAINHETHERHERSFVCFVVWFLIAAETARPGGIQMVEGAGSHHLHAADFPVLDEKCFRYQNTGGTVEPRVGMSS